MSQKSLTERQRQVLDYIDAETRQRGFPPSVREIGQAVGLNRQGDLGMRAVANLDEFIERPSCRQQFIIDANRRWNVVLDGSVSIVPIDPPGLEHMNLLDWKW